jgi:hypothetical protein
MNFCLEYSSIPAGSEDQQQNLCQPQKNDKDKILESQ